MSARTKGYGIIVGADGSPASNAAVCWAAHDAVLRHLPLTVVHVVNPVATTCEAVGSANDDGVCPVAP